MARPLHERFAALQLWRAGHSAKRVARLSGISRSTVQYWIKHFAGVAQTAEATDLKSVQWGFESLHQHQHAAYVYLLGLYLGDGCISRIPRTYVLRIFLKRRPASRHRRSGTRNLLFGPTARRIWPNRSMHYREDLLGRLAGNPASAWKGTEAFAAYRARTVARETRRRILRPIRPGLHPLGWLSASTNRQRQELPRLQLLKSVERYSEALHGSVSATRAPADTSQPGDDLDRSPT